MLSNKYMLSDLEVSAQYRVNTDGFNIINAKRAYAKCKGCFGCWVKTPSKCVLKDGMQDLGIKILSSDEIVIISKMLYGGFSVEVKRLWDRCIPGVLPFFTTREGKLHHKGRFKNNPKMRFYFYDTKDCTEQEKELAKNLAKANAINFMSVDYDVKFFDSLDDLLEENLI